MNLYNIIIEVNAEYSYFQNFKIKAISTDIALELLKQYFTENFPSIEYEIDEIEVDTSEEMNGDLPEILEISGKSFF